MYLLIQLPAVQDYARARVVTYLEKKFGTEVRIGKLDITFPRRLVLENVYFEDQKGQVLLAGEKIRVDLGMFELLNNKVELHYLQMDGIRANIYRTGNDTLFNFDYIIKAFATPATPGKADSVAPMEFNVGAVVLNRIQASFRDDQMGSDMYISLGKLNMEVDRFDPYHVSYAFPTVILANAEIRMKQYKPLATPRPMAVVEAENVPPAFDIDFDKLNLQQVHFIYDNSVSAVQSDINIGQLTADARSVDFDSLYIDLQDLQLTNTSTTILFGKSPLAQVAVREIGKEIKAQVNNPWRIRADRVLISNNSIRYDDNNNPRVPGAMDYSHLDFQQLNLGASGLTFSPAVIQASVEHGSFIERKSGVVLKELQTDLVYNDKQISIENLLLQTDRTLLRRRVELKYESLDAMAKRPGDIYLDADIESSVVAVRDIISFAPVLRSLPPFKGNEGEIFNIDAVVRGYIKDLSLPRFEVSGFRNTSVAASGRIRGLPGANPYYDLVVSRFSTTKTDLAGFLPRNAIPPTVRLPERISGRAVFKGTPYSYNTRLIAQTSKGNVDLTAKVNGQRYQARATATGLDVGYIFMQPNIGRASFQANINGNGFDFMKSPADINAYVSSAYLNGYNYHNIRFDGKLRNGVLSGSGDIKDSNADLDFAVTSDLKLKQPSLDLQMKVDSLNLYALGLSSVPFKIHGDLNINMPSLNMASLSGNATITNVVLMREGRRITIDSISISATPQSLSLRSPVGYADLNGSYNLTEIGFAVENIINRYYRIAGYREHRLTTEQQWNLTAKIYPSEALFAFMPELKGTDTISLAAALNTAANDLQATARTRKFVFKGQYADSLTFTAGTSGGRMLYSATALSAGSKDLRVYKTSVAGDIMNNLLTVRLDVKDQEDKSRYQVAGTATSIPGGYRFSLSQDSVMFNYEKWAVGAGNFIQSTNAGLLVYNFTISNGQQSLSANSSTQVPNSPVDLRFQNFQISTITNILNQDQLLMGGVINGTAVLSNFNTNPVFTSDLQ
ncbi:MAG TPA: hypothetical protein VF145_04025, partial [Chitinophagaceae bacterium]